MKVRIMLDKLSQLDPNLDVVVFRNLEFGGTEAGYYKDVNISEDELDDCNESEEGFFFDHSDGKLHKFVLIY